MQKLLQSGLITHCSHCNFKEYSKMLRVALFSCCSFDTNLHKMCFLIFKVRLNTIMGQYEL